LPTFLNIKGIKIDCYYGDHPPPHVHAIYGEYEALIEIEDLSIYGGYLPPRQLRQTLECIEVNQVSLKAIFNKMNPPKHKT